MEKGEGHESQERRNWIVTQPNFIEVSIRYNRVRDNTPNYVVARERESEREREREKRERERERVRGRERERRTYLLERVSVSLARGAHSLACARRSFFVYDIHLRVRHACLRPLFVCNTRTLVVITRSQRSLARSARFVHDIHSRVRHACLRSSFVCNTRILVVLTRSRQTCVGEPRMYRSVCVEFRSV